MSQILKLISSKFYQIHCLTSLKAPLPSRHKNIKYLKEDYPKLFGLHQRFL
uniref:Uncharacterized protein n=1 Tax=Arundo donax TaxID=35708 RepID=A0A0A8YRM1_ARUDO